MTITAQETMDRMYEELAALEALTASAPDDHPARIALAKIRAHLDDGPGYDWLDIHQGMSIRVMANEVVAGTVPGIQGEDR